MINNNLLEMVNFRPNRLVRPDSWIGHIPFAAWLMQQIKPSIFVELGVHSGNSYLGFCQSVKENKLQTKCFAIDTWKGDEHSGFYQEDIFLRLNEYHKVNYSEFSNLLRMEFDVGVSYFLDGSIELLHIDGLHTYNAIKHDFETWLPKLAPQAIVIFHDTNVRERGFGIWHFWSEIKQKYPLNFEFFHSNGLGIIQLAEKPGFFKLDFLHRNYESQDEFREYFSSLGHHINNQFKAQDLQLKLEEKEKTYQDLQLKLKEKEQSIQNFQIKFEEGKNVYLDSQTKLKEKENAYLDLQSKLKEKENAYLDSQSKLKEKENAFLVLQQNLYENKESFKESLSKLQELEDLIISREEILQNLNSKLLEIYNSTAWKFVKLMWKMRLKLFPLGSRREKIGKGVFHFFIRTIKTRPHPNFRKIEIQTLNDKSKLNKINKEKYDQENYQTIPLCDYFKPMRKVDEFRSWQAINKTNNLKRKAIYDALKSIEEKPLFSIIVPIYDPPIEIFKKTITSILNQTYEKIELILVDDHSNDPIVRQVIQEYSLQDKRIKTLNRAERGHISVATNSGIDIAVGEYLVFVDHDDEIPEDAIAQFAFFINANPEADIIYSDDAKINDTNNGLIDPKFKPDWSPELLLSYNYISHLKILRTSLVRSIGGFRKGFEGSQDHDLLLRASEKTNSIGHIPQILYFRRILPSSTASSGHAKPYSFEAGRKAVQEAFIRRGVNCLVQHTDWAYKAGLGTFTPIMPDNGPSVAIIIPTKNNKNSLEQLLISLEKTTYKNYEVYIVDNESDDLETINYLSNIHYHVFRIKNSGMSFNFSEINNNAVNLVSEEYVLFLNDDTQVINSQWLSQMVGWMSLPGVGAVGARLIYPDGKIQHAGIVLSSGTVISAFKGLDSKLNGYLMQGKVSRNCIAVTAAAMLTNKKIFIENGGFDQNLFKVAYNDVDYCLKLHSAGYRVVFCGEAELFHHESQSRGDIPENPEELIELKKKIKNFNDPFYNLNLSNDSTYYKIKPTVIPPVNLTKPINTLVVTHNLNYEGAPQSAYELISGLKSRKKINPVVISPFDGPLRSLYEKENIEVRIIENIWITSKIKDIIEYKEKISELCKIINLSKFDLVYSNTATTFWAIDAATMLGISSIWNIRESESWQDYYDNYPKSVAARALQSFAYPYRVIFVAKSTRLRWKLLEVMNNFEVIHNGLDYDHFLEKNSNPNRNESRSLLGLAKDDICMISVGTICERKGQKDLIHALEKLPENIMKKLSVFIIGATDNEYTLSLINLLKKLPDFQQKKIKIIKTTGELAIYWNSADIFCFTSRLESYPRVILEAMSKSLPIITTPTFGILEQVKENSNALFYEPGNVKKLAFCISKLVNNSELRLKFSKSSKLIFKTLISYEEMLDKYETIFNSSVFSFPSTYPYTENFSNLIIDDNENFDIHSIRENHFVMDIFKKENQVPTIRAILPRLSNGIPDIPSFVRVIRPLRHRSLVDVLNLSLQENFFDSSSENFDILMVQRNAVTSIELSEKIINFCNKKHIPILFEIDDNLFDLPSNHPSFTRYTDSVKQIMKNFAENAKAIIVSTPTLKEYFENLNENIFVLINALDESIWIPDSNIQDQYSISTPHILYMGTQTHQHDVKLVNEVLKKIKNVYQDKVSFSIIGGVTNINLEHFEHIKIPGWIQTYTDFVRWFTKLNKFNIGIAPLLDNNFNTYKSYLKYLDYGISGLAPILSDVKTYQNIVIHGENGLLTNNSQEDWFEAIAYLIENPLEVNEIKRKAYFDIVKNHTLESQSEERRLFWKEIVN